MPRRVYSFHVYIVASRSRTLYIGFTNDLARRLAEHNTAPLHTFTGHYRINRLVHLEHFTYVRNAIAREKELKSWSRTRKLALVSSANPTWEDLSPLLLPAPTNTVEPSHFRPNITPNNSAP